MPPRVHECEIESGLVLNVGHTMAIQLATIQWSIACDNHVNTLSWNEV